MATKKKLTPASICSQKAWSGLSKTVKKELRKSLPDKDKDGVPNKYDCRPKNKRRQETFLPDDAAYLNSDPEIRIGKKLGQGAAGEVFTVKGNKNLVVKIPRGAVDTNDEYAGTISYDNATKTAARLRREIENYNRLNLEHEPMCTPTHVVDLGYNSVMRGNMVGLVRPKLNTINDVGNHGYSKSLKKLTDAQVETIRQKLIELSYKGFVINDGLQIGIDRAGRPLLYDLEGIESAISWSTLPEIFTMNNHLWKRFLFDIGKLYGTEDKKGMAKYGEIKFNLSRHS